MKHPFLGVQNDDKILVLSSTRNGELLRFRTQEIKPNDKNSLHFQSIDDAEDHVLTTVFADHEKLNDVKLDETLIILSRRITSIQQETRRRHGWAILLNTWTFDKLFSHHSWIERLTDQTSIGRWTPHAKFNDDWLFYVSDCIENAEVYIFYKGKSEIDTCGVLTDSDNGVWLTLQKSGNSVGHDYNSFVRVLKFIPATS